MAMAGPARPAGTIDRRLEGNVQALVVEDRIRGTVQEDLYQAELWGPKFRYVLERLPEAEYEVTLGFADNFFSEAGGRVFSVWADDELVIDHLDIAAEVGKGAALTRTFRVPTPDGRLVLAFRAHVDNAKVCTIELSGEGSYFFDSAMACTDADLRAKAVAPPGTYETAIGKLGSRICYNFRPQQRTVFSSPMGRFYDRARPMLLAAAAGGEMRVMPFVRSGELFAEMEQRVSMTSVSFTGRDPAIPFDVTYRFVAPFYPGDVKLSTAPVLYLELIAENRGRGRASAEMLFGMAVGEDDEMEALPDGRGAVIRTSYADVPCEEAYGPLQGASDLTFASRGLIPDDLLAEPALPERDDRGRVVLTVFDARAFMGFRWACNLDPGERDVRRFVLAGYTGEPVLDVRGAAHRFKYAQYFGSVGEVVDYARHSFDTARRRTRLMDETVEGATLSRKARNLIAYTFQSFIFNTWWTVADDGRDWFSVWEGCCLFHSTIDVEYNYGLVYFQYWPGLLGMLLDEWPLFERDGVLRHDMGMGREVAGMAYPHDMEVEENTNYLLMLHHYWKLTGDLGPARRHREMIGRVVDYLISADTNGNGFPDVGTANTIDQGSPAIQYSKEQTYLAVRCLAAFEVTAELARELGDEALAGRCESRPPVIRRTLDEAAWLGDHYAVCLDPDQTKLRDVWTGEGLSGETVEGWDAYSIYASNGLLYPLRSGFRPGVDYGRIVRDIARGYEMTIRPYGCPHTSIEQNLWISQNIWRDMVAMYLGMDLSDELDRYWDFNLYVNSTKQGCFNDVYNSDWDTTGLNYYPRGITSIGVLWALGRLQVDAESRTVRADPLRKPLRIPLTFLADWEGEMVPWLCFDGEGRLTVENECALGGWRVIVGGSDLTR